MIYQSSNNIKVVITTPIASIRIIPKNIACVVEWCVMISRVVHIVNVAKIIKYVDND